jgi:uncharacterized protein YfaS (alpha-2-macroglobulin family)
MAPNSYVSVSVIQPHNQTLNDRPLRMYGVVPISVSDPQTHLNITLSAPNALKPNEPFEISIQTTDQKPAQFTLAVVDEGLLDITRFATPAPHQSFFNKRRLSVEICDLFAQVIGVNAGDIFKTFAIGGDLMAAYRQDQLDTEQKRRFKAVSLFKGPITTDDKGNARVLFDMPDYVGSVRIMAVAARGNAYGHADKTVPVKTDLMILPTLPRVLGPGDSIAIPVTVFAMADSLGPVEVTLTTEGFLDATGATTQTVTFESAGEQDITFAATAQKAIGSARITLTAKTNTLTTTQTTNLEVRPSSPPQPPKTSPQGKPSRSRFLTKAYWAPTAPNLPYTHAPISLFPTACFGLYNILTGAWSKPCRRHSPSSISKTCSKAQPNPHKLNAT